MSMCFVHWGSNVLPDRNIATGLSKCTEMENSETTTIQNKITQKEYFVSYLCDFRVLLYLMDFGFAS